jgi:hypothetical protein
VRAEVVRLLPLLKAAGWNVDPIHWESTSETSIDRRISFSAKSDTGKQFRSTCPESSLPARLTFLLTNTT